MGTVRVCDRPRRELINYGAGYGTDTLLGLRALWRWGLQLCAKHTVPEATCDTEAVLKISVVMLQVILLELLVVERETGIC